MTADKHVLNIISGYDIEFNNRYKAVMSSMTLPKHSFDVANSVIINDLIKKLLSMGVVEKCFHSDIEYISPVSG